MQDCNAHPSTHPQRELLPLLLDLLPASSPQPSLHLLRLFSLARSAQRDCTSSESASARAGGGVIHPRLLAAAALPSTAGVRSSGSAPLFCRRRSRRKDESWSLWLANRRREQAGSALAPLRSRLVRGCRRLMASVGSSSSLPPTARSITAQSTRQHHLRAHRLLHCPLAQSAHRRAPSFARSSRRPPSTDEDPVITSTRSSEPQGASTLAQSTAAQHSDQQLTFSHSLAPSARPPRPRRPASSASAPRSASSRPPLSPCRRRSTRPRRPRRPRSQSTGSSCPRRPTGPTRARAELRGSSPSRAPRRRCRRAWQRGDRTAGEQRWVRWRAFGRASGPRGRAPAFRSRCVCSRSFLQRDQVTDSILCSRSSTGARPARRRTARRTS